MMPSDTLKCFLAFSYEGFVAQLMQQSGMHHPSTSFNDPGKAVPKSQDAAGNGQTSKSLSCTESDLKYLTRKEADQIIAQFQDIPQSSDRLLFWTGVPRDWAQRWADEHGLLTLTSAMGPLMDVKDKRCLKSGKGKKNWKKYVKGASAIFARYACGRGVVRVLTLPPSRAEFLRPSSSYRTLEEPVLKGSTGYCCAVQINFVHLLSDSRTLEYQIWPEDHRSGSLECSGARNFVFRLPPWILKASKMTRKDASSLQPIPTAFRTC
jgi:hypothetical protein